MLLAVKKKKVHGIGPFWLAFCRPNIKGENAAILWIGRKVANTCLSVSVIYFTPKCIYFFSMRYQTAGFFFQHPQSKMLHGNRTSWELYKEMCCVFTTICRNVLFRQISEFKIWDFLLPLFIHTSFLDILKLRGTNFLSTDKHERVETMFSRCWNKYFVYLFQTEHFKYLHL